MTDADVTQPNVRTTRDGAVAVVTLSRPQARNALDSATILQLRATLAEADADDGIAVVVLTGADPAFCAGLDLREVASSGENLKLINTEGLPPGAPWAPLSKPLIGAVNGAAITGGFELALHCDILLASERAVFADTHLRVGVMPGWGLSVLLRRAVGAGLAYRLSLTGDFLGAEAARQAGLVTDVLPHADLLPEAIGLAKRIAEADRTIVATWIASSRQIGALINEPALRVEAEVCERWLARGFDAAETSARRAAVVDRGRALAERATTARP